ncbi:hypothetical protein PCANC_01190 [Puccinia coronata f. sp. avenae]|uniref:Uncharacterized protein n=1 Tax=Puccinia coronata f. sp. avenae TaxID=200324 RepID=A0A2N5W3S9_9BASI|nr:hypothetical protein PCANC_01190 [Puccinia coronata f. sp. avenae]
MPPQVNSIAVATRRGLHLVSPNGVALQGQFTRPVPDVTFDQPPPPEISSTKPTVPGDGAPSDLTLIDSQPTLNSPSKRLKRSNSKSESDAASNAETRNPIASGSGD